MDVVGCTGLATGIAIGKAATVADIGHHADIAILIDAKQKLANVSESGDRLGFRVEEKVAILIADGGIAIPQDGKIKG